MENAHHPVDAIFEAFKAKGVSLAGVTGLSRQTVSDWRIKGKEIPPWRRAVVLTAAVSEGIQLPPHCVEYLASSDRSKAA